VTRKQHDKWSASWGASATRPRRPSEPEISAVIEPAPARAMDSRACTRQSERPTSRSAFAPSRFADSRISAATVVLTTMRSRAVSTLMTAAIARLRMSTRSLPRAYLSGDPTRDVCRNRLRRAHRSRRHLAAARRSVDDVVDGRRLGSGLPTCRSISMPADRPANAIISSSESATRAAHPGGRGVSASLRAKYNAALTTGCCPRDSAGPPAGTA